MNTHSMWESTSYTEESHESSERVAKLLRAALGILLMSVRNRPLTQMSTDRSAGNRLNIEGHFGALTIGSKVTSRKQVNDDPAVSPKVQKASHVSGSR